MLVQHKVNKKIAACALPSTSRYFILVILAAEDLSSTTDAINANSCASLQQAGFSWLSPITLMSSIDILAEQYPDYRNVVATGRELD